MDYGLDASNAEHRGQMRAIINNIYYNPNQIRVGSFKGQKNAVKFYIRGNDVIITDMNGNFVSILKDRINNPSVNNANVIYDSNPKR